MSYLDLARKLQGKADPGPSCPRRDPRVSATKPLDPAEVLEEIGKALVGLRDDPRGSNAWALICSDPDLRDRFAASEAAIQQMQRSGDTAGMRIAVGVYRGVINEALGRARARWEMAAEGRAGDGR